MTETIERLTDEQLMNLPEDGFKHEYVDGEVTSVPTSGIHDKLILRLNYYLYPVLSGRGELTCGQAGFRMVSGNIRVPDYSFMDRNRLPKGRASQGFTEGAPDLCVEVISPSETQDDMFRKIGEYFDSGARQVWHVFPETRRIVVYRSMDNVTTYTETDELDAGGLIPDFCCRVADLFEGV